MFPDKNQIKDYLKNFLKIFLQLVCVKLVGVELFF